MHVRYKKTARWNYLLGSTSFAMLMTLSPATRVLAADSDQAGDAGTLEEITVHAQRRAENLQSVPITVDTVSGVDASARGITSIQTLATTIPNLTFTTALFGTNMYIRGVGDDSASPNNEPSVATYVDGVYYPVALALTTFNFNNIQQIEVLKGPQGTLFGRNSTAGVVQIITPDPKHDFSGKIEGGYGNYDTYSGDAYVTGGLTDKLAADLAVLYDNQIDGFGRDLTTTISIPVGRQTSSSPGPGRGRILADTMSTASPRKTTPCSMAPRCGSTRISARRCMVSASAPIAG
jgi:iron complex outermembrane recepter protein